MRIRFVLLITCCFLLVTPETYAISKKKLNDRIERYNNYLEEVMEIPETAVPSNLLKSCQGILIMRQYKAGFIFGVKGGSGVALKRDMKTGKWSAPTFVVNAEGSFGLQIGGQAIDAILLIMNKSGVESLLKAKCKLGVDASIAAGPLGRDAEAKIGPDTAFLVYSKAKGLYGGLSFEGGIISQNGGANKKFYGKKVTVKEIFKGEVDVPEEANVLIKTLEKYCK
jgi:lipid-binding SYLF domain-containing protein